MRPVLLPRLGAALVLLLLVAATANAQPAARVYLPLVSQPAGPPASIRFGAGLVDGTLTGAGTSFDAGLTTLFYEVTVEGAAGQPFRLEWTVSGQRRRELDREGALPADGTPFTGGIALSTAAPLPPGTYQLRVFVGGLSSGAGQATIR